MEQTLAIVKPLAYSKGHSGAIITAIEQAGFTIQKIERTQFTKEEGAYFYAMHADKPFYEELVTYISSGPVVVMILEKSNAIADFRELIGATDPNHARPDTLRAQYGTSLGENALHGSDSTTSAVREIAFIAKRGQRCGSRGCRCQ